MSPAMTKRAAKALEQREEAARKSLRAAAPAAKARQRYIKRHAQLKADRASWDDHWRDLADNMDPRRSRFLTTDTNKGNKRNQNIINNTPIRAKATLQAGMHAGLTSPAQPWFRCVAPTPELTEIGAVKEWLHAVETTLREVFARSNIYNAFHTIYGDIATFGTAVLYLEEDVEDVLRAWVFPVGSYCLSLDGRGRVAVVFRETSLKVCQLVELFGLENCSETVQQLHAKGELDQPFDVVHVIEPNDEYQEGLLGPKGKPFRSCWYESQGAADVGLLREAGYGVFPACAPRWTVTGEDTYGSSNPGMEALGDCRALQLYEKREAAAFDKVVNPPMKGPSSMNGQRISLLPGDFTYTDSMSPASAFSPAHEVNPQALPAFQVKRLELERHINDACYASLFLAITGREGQMTAKEVAERHEEKLMQIGPATFRLFDELLAPAIDIAFDICLGRNLFPPPPLELQGFELKIEFISTLAQAQKILSALAIERVVSFVINMAPVKTDVLDVIDFDQAIQEYANMHGVPPAIVRTDEMIAAIRKAVAEAQQAKAQQEQAMEAAQGAKTLSETNLEDDSALKRILAGMNAPAPQPN